MKSRFKNRKAFEAIANTLGISDKTHHVIYTDPYTKQESMRLVNNFSRFVNGMLKLDPNEQLLKLQQFQAQMTEILAEQAQVRAEMNKMAADELVIKNPLEQVAEAAVNSGVEEAFKPLK